MTPSAPSPDSPPPAISVIVRSMDRPCLAAALASVAAQECPGVEVLVVAACGPTHGALPAEAGVHPVRRIDTGQALQRSAAANAGLDAACGRRVIFLDDDDVFLPGHLGRLAAALDEAPDAVAAYADVAYGRDGPDGWQSMHLFGDAFDALRLRFENFIPLHAALVDRSRGAAHECRFDPSLDLFEDWDWWLQLAARGRFVHVPGVSARYVAAAGGGSGVFADDAAAADARRRLQLKWLQRDGPEDRLALLNALQENFRHARQAEAQLALAGRTAADLRAMLAARDADLAAAAQQHVDLQHIIAARDAELGSLGAVLAARDREIIDFGVQLADLQEVVAARDREIVDFGIQLTDLQQVVAARDREIASLKEVVTARDAEVADGHEYAQSLRDVLAARDEEIANLRPRREGD